MEFSVHYGNISAQGKETGCLIVMQLGLKHQTIQNLHFYVAKAHQIQHSLVLIPVLIVMLHYVV